MRGQKVEKLDDLLKEMDDLLGDEKKPSPEGKKTTTAAPSLQKPPAPASNPKPTADPAPKKVEYGKAKSKKDDNLDSLFNDIISKGVEEKKAEELPAKRASTSMESPGPTSASNNGINRTVSIKKSKCLHALLSPENVATAGFGKRVCNKLRCLTCDRKVNVYFGYKWDSTVDYLFVRNFSSDFEQLKPRMIVSKTSAAYCCQCMWKSIESPTEVENLTDVRWVCTGHTPDNSF